ncbi:MAG: ABC transporter ATP-binding protein [Roseburia hominis]
MSLVKSVFKVFDGKQKRKLFGMAFLILINSGVSLLGVSVLLPFIQAVTAPEELLANRYVAAFYEWMGMENPNELITAIAIGIVIVYLAKNAFIIFMNNMQYRFSYYGKREMQDRLMKYYISKDYTFFLNHNSAELMRDINNDPEMFYAAVLNMLQLAAELCTSTILIIFLVVTDPIITLGVALAMMLMVLLFMKKLKRTLARFGDERRKYNANIIQCMQQAFGGIKEIKIANRESYFEEEFRKQNGLYTYVIKQNAFLSSIPKPVMEALCIAGLMITIAVRINMTESDPTHFVGVLAVFAAAAFYLLPSANKMSEYLASIIHNGVVIHKIGEEYTKIRDLEIDLSEERDYPAMALEREIRVNDMTFTYPEMEEPVLSHVNVTIPKNSSVAFIGPSGAGKTTMVDLILGVLKPQEGQITLDGVDSTSYRGWHDKIGYIPQTIYMLDDTIRNNIAFGKKEGINDEDVWAALRQAQLDEFVESLEEGLDTVIGEAGVRLSGGQRQRIGIARALYRKPEVLVLDEATSALDTETEAAVMQAIDSLQGKMTMLIIAHRLSTIKNCNIVYKVENGSVTVQDAQ